MFVTREELKRILETCFSKIDSLYWQLSLIYYYFFFLLQILKIWDKLLQRFWVHIHI